MGDVLAIDLSLASTGVAEIYTTFNVFQTLQTDAIKSSGRRADSVQDRALRIQDMRDRIVSWVGLRTSLVVIESPSFGSQGAGTWDRAGLWWAVVSWLVKHEMDIAMISPLSLKKYATSNGRADKQQMIDACEQASGIRPKTSDEADAFWLAMAGAQFLGVDDLPLLPHNDFELLRSKASWPSL